MTAPGNPERSFLMGILSISEDRENQLKYLGLLGMNDFADYGYQAAFKACCAALMTGNQLNLETFAKALRGKVNSEEFRRVCFDMHVKKIVDCLPEVDARLQSLIEELKIRSLERKYQEAV